MTPARLVSPALAAAILVAVACGGRVELNQEYHAVLLDNNSVYFGRVENFGGEHLVLRDVYYVQTQVNPETKQSSNILIRRGGEWHRPDRMIIDSRHVVFLEPVTQGSQVAKLIEEDRRRK